MMMMMEWGWWCKQTGINKLAIYGVILGIRADTREKLLSPVGHRLVFGCISYFRGCFGLSLNC